MRVAVCYSGQLRTGPGCIENHKAYFEGLDVEVFAHVWSVNTDKRHPLNQPPTKVPEDIIKRWANRLGVRALQIEDPIPNGTRNDAGHIAIYDGWIKSVHLKQAYERETGAKFDITVKLRPDIILNPYRKLARELELIKDREFLVELFGYGPHGKVWYDDTIWMARNHVMDEVVAWYEKNLLGTTYGEFFNCFAELNIPLLPSSHVGYYYAILRKGCIGMDPIKDFQKIWKYDDNYKRRIKPLPEPVDYYDPSLKYNES